LSGIDQRCNLSRLITAIERGELTEEQHKSLREQAQFLAKSVPVLGITGTGGAGKSSLTDELIRRFRQDSDDKLKIAVLAIDPTRRKTGGALLGDRIRMNAIYQQNIFMRSIGTRGASGEVPESLTDIISALRLGGFDLVVVETPGIGQGDAGIVPYVDIPIYVMTPEFGAQSQLEKIDMLDYAELAIINKFDRKGSDDASRFSATAKPLISCQSRCQCLAPLHRALMMMVLPLPIRACLNYCRPVACEALNST
jgi:methylmalonyl-CoA mutase